MAEVVWRRASGEACSAAVRGHLAGLDPGPPVGDGGQFATPDPGEQAAVSSRAEAGVVFAEQSGQFGVGRDDGSCHSWRSASHVPGGRMMLSVLRLVASSGRSPA